MKIYEASQELVDLLLANGFVEDTQVNYPEHAARLKDKAYDPHGMKRHFKFPGTREKVYFDYINMRLPGNNDRYKITEEELRSMIAYLRLSATDRSALNNEKYHALSIPEIIRNMDRAPMIYSKPVYKRAKAQFDLLDNLCIKS
jgi:hypothetical protein